MEKYLYKCLDSLIVDNMDLLEVLIINDGSKDRSSEIAHEYEKKYPQTFRVIDKENGNYGSCINRGLKEATGKYIKVLDADDSFDTKYLKIYINKLQTLKVDLILSDYVIVNELGEKGKKGSYTIKDNIINNYDIDICHAISSCLQMHSVAYLRCNLINVLYTQTEGISYTDQEWIFLPMTTVKQLFYIKLPLYKYLIGRTGQTMNKEVANKSFPHIVKITHSLTNTYQNYHGDIIYKEFLLKRIYYYLLYHYNNLIMNGLYPKDKFIELDKFIAKNIPEISGLLDMVSISKYFPYKYIKKWREKYQNVPYIIKLLYKLRCHE